MFSIFIVFGFFSAFINPFGMISYFSVLRTFKVKLASSDVFFLFYMVFIFITSLYFAESIVDAVTIFRFYFGFFIFYLYFKSGADLPVGKIFLLLLIIIPLETLLINTIISPYSMPNFPSEDMISHFNPGGYQRPYSFAGNAAVASSLFVIVLSMLSVSSIYYFVSIAYIFIFASGTGMISMLVLIYLRLIGLKVKSFFISIFIVLLFFFVVFYSGALSFLDNFGLKLNSKYIYFLFEFKIDQFFEKFENYKTIHYFFGNLNSLGGAYGGDFGWLYFILAYGWMSFLIFFIFIFSKINKKNSIPIIIALIATFHYPVIFFLPGQILLGYLMSLSHKND